MSKPQDKIPAYWYGDTNGNGKLDPTEVWVYRATGTVVPGQYTNMAAVSATSGTATVVSRDSANYFGTTGIRIKKAVNAIDALHPTAAEEADTFGPTIAAGTGLTFTYRVFGSMRSHVVDELVADFVGLARGFGGYRADLALRFLGLEAFPAYRTGGRLEHYRGSLSLRQTPRSSAGHGSTRVSSASSFT